MCVDLCICVKVCVYAINNPTYWQMDRQTAGQADRQTKLTEREREIKRDKEINREREIERDKKIHKVIGREIERERERETKR